MNVIRERPCQRRYHRVTAPLKVTFPDGETYTATNWSLGGLRLDGYRNALPEVGAIFTLTFELPFQGFDISFDVETRIVRATADGSTLGMEFTELSERAHDLMNHFINDLVRGQMATVEDTICRIDVPVTPISTKPDPNPLSETPAFRIPFKQILMVTLYLCLGLVVFGYLGLLFYSNVMRIEVKSAVVTRPLVTMKMPMDGKLVDVSMRGNSTVSQGQTLARIISPEFEARYSKAKSKVEDGKRELDLVREKYRIENERMKLYRIVSNSDVAVAQARVAAAKEALSAKDETLLRTKKLWDKGLTTLAALQDAQKEAQEAKSRLDTAQAELEKSTAMNSVSKRRYFNHKEFVADLDMLALDIEQKNAELMLAFDLLEELEEQRNILTIRAPFDGKVVASRLVSNVFHSRNDVLVTLERTTAPKINAFVTQDQAVSIGLNDIASVYLPSSGREVQAVVANIDRNGVFIDEAQSQYVWQDGIKKTAVISLKLLDNSVADQLPGGLPAIVLLPKRTTNNLVNRLTTFFRASSGEAGHVPSI